ncbi:MBL fold metallo-hydrolase [Terribacillus sp. DMT04]|uniref:MBL fold metallo-hydrolase n=1 Tax=Terribacillus sp. DMT04 TaxID=2850441 RepID=UPI001C2BA607|nr:MBL fold metallo-hydrolase [Terribacillus sp. DMT04]QXE02169.1 MBL fold metallo-hydrolase [Terribacillus sp. DMT04]
MNPLHTAELAEKVKAKETVHLLDIRQEADVQDWAVDAENIIRYNIPFAEIKANPTKTRNILPDNDPVYVMCYKGKSAQTAVSLLEAAGMDKVVHVVGGMQAWGETMSPRKIGDLTYGGAIYQFMRIGKGCLSYMIVSNGEAAVVDPARFTEVYTSFANDNGWQIKHVLDTHLHADHLSGGRKLAEETGATYWFPADDGKEAAFAFSPLKDGISIPFGQQEEGVRCVASPGHTEGSVSFVVDDTFLLSGDILFTESIGRPDLAGQAEQWVQDLHTTLYEKYPMLSLDLIVLPSHFSELSEIGSDGTVQARMEDLYRKNPRLQMQDAGAFTASVLGSIPDEQPNSYQLIRESNQGKETIADAEEAIVESGPNRCAVNS